MIRISISDVSGDFWHWAWPDVNCHKTKRMNTERDNLTVCVVKQADIMTNHMRDNTS